MKILKKIILITFCIVVMLLIKKMESKALERDMKYKPSKEYLKKVSLKQEIRYCVEMCFECIVLNVNTTYYYNIVMNQINKNFSLKLKNTKNCFNQCYIKDQRPLQRMFNWWLKNTADLNSSICILNYAVKHDL